MKKIFYHTIMAIAATSLLFFSSCNKDSDDDTTPELGAPTIEVTSPEIPAGGLDTETGETTIFTLSLTAEAGLSSVKVGETNIKTFTGTETSDVVTYDYIPLEAGTVTLTFVVEDAAAKTTSINVIVNVTQGEDLGYLLLDFAGASTSSEDVTIVDWDIRTRTVFNVTGSHGTSATGEVVNKQGQLSYAQDNPTEGAKVLKYEQIRDTARDDWGGWAHVIFGLGTVIPEASITALPTWDADNSATVAGTKVMKLDVYYDATVDAGFTWDNLLAKTDVWGSDPSLGYSVHLSLCKFDPYAIGEGAYDGAFYLGYMSYISEANKWVTLTFDNIDVARVASMIGTAEDAPLPSEIDCIRIMPAGGYAAVNSNPLYMRNLRIVDVE